MKLSLAIYTPMQTAALRISIGALAMLPLAIIHIKKVPKKYWLHLTISGFLGNGIPAFLYMKSLSKIDSNLAGILNALTPIWVLIIGLLFFKAKPSKYKILGIVLGFLGIAILFLFKNKIVIEDPTYIFLVLGATLCYGLNINFLSNKLIQVPSLSIAALSILPAGILYFIYLCIGIEGKNILELPFNTVHILYVIFLGAVATSLGNILFFVLIKRSNANFASMVTYIMPIVSIFIGYVSGETIGIQALLCFALILTGVILVKKG